MGKRRRSTTRKKHQDYQIDNFKTDFKNTKKYLICLHVPNHLVCVQFSLRTQYKL